MENITSEQIKVIYSGISCLWSNPTLVKKLGIKIEDLEDVSDIFFDEVGPDDANTINKIVENEFNKF